MTEPKGFRTANRRYFFVFWPMMVLYLVILFFASRYIDEETAPLGLRIAGAVATTLPVAGSLWAVLRLVRETDEYTRMRQLNALAQGGVITASIAFLVGFLQIFNAVGPVDVFWFGGLFFLAYGVSHCVQHFGKTV